MSCSIIAKDANYLMRAIHDRMPVILASGDWGT
ncbi:SOS response-associated peptidase family protein [Methylotuvimicrobium sp.]